VWVDRGGHIVGVVRAQEEIGISPPELAPGGRQAAVSRTVQGNVDIWLIELNGGIANRFTFHTAMDAATAVWSPDGSRVVFRSSRNDGRFDLFEKPANGAAEEQPLLVTDQDKSATDWSPDGRFLLYTTSDRKTQSDLWALPLIGERKPIPVVQTTFDETEGQFSPDGRWIAYTSNESGRYEIYVRPFLEPGGKRQVSTSGGIYPRCGLDGRELFYVTLDNQLMAVPMQLALPTRDLAPGVAIPLFRSRLELGGNTGVGGYSSRAMYDVARDGRFLMVVTSDDTAPPPITIVLNWTAALGE
jgi:Tol biopolymer transport system component